MIFSKGKEPETIASTSGTSPEVHVDEVPANIAHPDPHVQDIIDDIQNATLYLGNPSLLQNVHWVDGDRKRVLVENKDMDTDINIDVPEPAILQVVGVISTQKFWLYPCGGWSGERGPKNAWPNPTPFEKAKARGRICSLRHHARAQDWKMSVENLNKIAQTAVPSRSSQIECDKDSLVSENQLRVRHAIFEVRT
jgi:hypothetical protein